MPAQPQLRVIHIGVKDWLLVDAVIRPRFIIHYGPAVHSRTHETHIIYRIVQWSLEREHRSIVGWTETLNGAIALCEYVVRPRPTTPLLDHNGGVISIERQLRWNEAGLDFRTGQPPAIRRDGDLIASPEGVRIERTDSESA